MLGHFCYAGMFGVPTIETRKQILEKGEQNHQLTRPGPGS